jgi:hypothetical protein
MTLAKQLIAIHDSVQESRTIYDSFVSLEDRRN